MADRNARRIWLQLLLAELEGIINCWGSPEDLESAIAWAKTSQSAAIDQNLGKKINWVRAACIAKHNSQGKSRRGVSAYLLWKWSCHGEKDREKRERLLNQAEAGQWLRAKDFQGAYLTQVQACRLLSTTNCECEEKCKGINFTREREKIERIKRKLDEAKEVCDG